ncbi:MAG: TonB-dependent receptor plug domain-containing protein [Muribaculaceae bacterium]|jgi:TonB-dependent Receptor Plug Domain.|nr:TonB-dependent receptor plug domain-containing protein [Muribaculaceae bacterium]
MRKILTSIMLALASVGAVWASEPFNGLLLDLDGKPVKGAKIYVHNPKQYAKSDKHGKFGLTDVKPTDTIHVIVKKKVYAVPVNGSKGMRISVGEITAKGIEDQELVSAGIGYVKKREYLGPRSGVTGEELAATGESDLIMAMRGKIPGLLVLPDGSVSIRGSASFNANTPPLWIVDGSQSTTPPSLTVMEVEKVEVIKDGAGYGTRGANGVIIVTLKGSK